MNFSFVKDLSEWLWSTFGEDIVKVAFVTNGTILTKDIKEWIYENRARLSVAVSIDGIPEVHNKNRSNSFSKIDLDFFLSLYKKLPVKMTVPPNSLDYLYEGFLFLYEKGCIPDVALAAETTFSRKHKDILISELKKIIGFYSVHHDLPVTEFLFFPFERLSPSFPDKRWEKHRCGIESARLAIDTKGNFYPCQTFISDFQKEYSIDNIQRVNQQIRSHTWRDLFDACNNCLIREICSPCYGLNYSYRGAINAIDVGMCDVTTIVALASANLWTNILLNQTTYPWLSNYEPDLLSHRLIGLNTFINRINEQ